MTQLFARTRTAAHWTVAALALALLAGSAAVSAAQSAPERTGKLVGQVIDAETGAGIADAGVQVVGTTLGASSGVDGRYTVVGVPAGTVTIQVRRIGYQPKTVTGLLLEPGQTLEQSVTLSSAALRLTATVVTASAERGTVAEALDQQRNAAGIVTAITSEQIARSPDADAAQAVQRVSGVTVQGGRYVFVRGLGERYTTASLNGARLPSPEPERKVVPLDLFPSGLIQSITTAKTFTPDLPGDFSGASVDIKMREFPARRTVSYSTTVGANATATGQRVFAAPTVGREWLGYGGSARAMPTLLAAHGGRLPSAATQGDFNSILRSFRNAWAPESHAGTPNYSTSASVGGEDPVLGHRVGYLASGSYSYAQEVRADEEIAFARLGTSEPFNAFRGSTGRTSVLWGGLLNLSSWAGKRSKISLDNTYNRTADNEAHQDEGINEEYGHPVRRSVLRFIERTVRSNQLRGEHVLPHAQGLDWSLTSSGVTRAEPDRAELVYGQQQPDQPLAWLSNRPESARRTFGDLTESSLSGDVSYRLTLGSGAGATNLKAGALVRRTERDASTRQYNIQNQTGRLLSAEERAAAPEQIFGTQYTGDGDDVFRIQDAAIGGRYEARDQLGAGFVMAERPLGSRLRVIAGARVERAEIRVISETFAQAGLLDTATLSNTDVLPAAVVNVRLGEQQALRLSASQTLSRPEYREISPVPVRELVNQREMFGNADLRRALIQNYDVKWEWYPSAGEVLSAGAFAKRFDAPIERVDVATTGFPQITFINSRSAVNYGVELELRKGLGALVERLTPLTMFANATVMKSEIDLGPAALINGREVGLDVTNRTRPMVGQSPYVVNAGLTYMNESGRASATALYNVVGRRINAAAIGGLPDTYELPRHVLDLSVQLPVRRTVSAKVDLKNLFDAPFTMEQGGVTRERNTAGRVYQVGLSWRP